MTQMVTEYPTMTFTSRADLRFDKRDTGWELVEDVEFEGNPVLGLYEFLHDNEKYVKGEVMLGCAKKLGNCAGQRHAERMLEQEHRIPKVYRELISVFPGTLWRHPDGHLYVPCLFWSNFGWSTLFCRVDVDWDDNNRIVRIC